MTAATRDRLLQAAEHLFSEKGYASVGIREIAEEAEANVAAIQYHFGGKRELYLETVRFAMSRRETAQVWDVFARRPRTRKEAAEQIALFIRLMLHKLLRDPAADFSGTLMLRECSQPTEAIDAVVRDFIQPHLKMLTSVLAVIDPHADAASCERTAHCVLGQVLFHRTCLHFLARLREDDLQTPEVIDRIARHVAGFTLRGLGCSPRIVEGAVDAAHEAALEASEQ